MRPPCTGPSLAAGNCKAQKIWESVTLSSKSALAKPWEYDILQKRSQTRRKEAHPWHLTKERPATKTIATNREARHEYFVLEALETGVELKGTEVKSLRAGGVNLKDSWVDIEDGELLVKGMHITPYDHGNIFNQDPHAGAASAGPQERDPAAAPAVQAAGLHPGAALALLQAWPREDGSWACARAKSSTTSAPMPPSATPSAPSTGP